MKPEIFENKQITNEILSLPINEYFQETHECIPAVYGKYMTKKIVRDCHFKLKEIAPQLELGDCQYNNKIFYEVKMSYLSKLKNTRYRIKNIRPYQNFNFFILVFIDPYKSYKEKIYVVPKSTILDNPLFNLGYMHGTSKSNKNNTKVELSTSVDDDDLDFIFGPENLLDGTKYSDLMKYINLIDNPIQEPIKSKSSARSKITQVGFNVTNEHQDITTIHGYANYDAVRKLVNFIGPQTLFGIVGKYLLDKSPRTEQFVDAGHGFYANYHQSIRDIMVMVNRINLNTKYHVEIVKS